MRPISTRHLLLLAVPVLVHIIALIAVPNFPKMTEDTKVGFVSLVAGSNGIGDFPENAKILHDLGTYFRPSSPIVTDRVLDKRGMASGFMQGICPLRRYVRCIEPLSGNVFTDSRPSLNREAPVGLSFNVPRGRFSAIDKFEPKLRASSLLRIFGDVILGQSDPGSLIQAELFDSGLKRFISLQSIEAGFYGGLLCSASCVNHLSVLQVNQIGIDDDGAKGQGGNKKRGTFIVPLIACIFCLLVNLYAFGKIYRSDYFWGWAMLIIAALMGLAYCFGLFIQSTL